MAQDCGESLAFYFALKREMGTNNIVKICKPQTCLKWTQFALQLHKKNRTTICRGTNYMSIKNQCKTPEWIADTEISCFDLEMQHPS